MKPALAFYYYGAATSCTQKSKHILNLPG